MTQIESDLQLVLISLGRSYLINSEVIYVHDAESKAIDRLTENAPEHNGIDWKKVKSKVKPALKWWKD